MRITLVLTHQCNLACGYCYAGEKFNRRMPDDIAWKALKLAFETESPQPLTVSFFGGEPLLEFARMAKWTRLAYQMAQRKGRQIEFSVTTNATIISEKIIRFFQHYPYQVAFSIDGLAETHGAQRPFTSGRSSGDLVWKNLEIISQRLPNSQILSVVTPQSVAQVPDMLRGLHRLGFQSVSLLPNVEDNWTPEAKEAARVSYQLAADYSLASRLTSRPIWVSPFSDYSGESSSEHGCGFGHLDVAVAPTGNLYPCARLVGADLRTDVRIGQVSSGVDAQLVRNVRGRSKAKLVGCGLEEQCGCTGVMAGKSLEQLNNLAFFREIALQACQMFHDRTEALLEPEPSVVADIAAMEFA